MTDEPEEVEKPEEAEPAPTVESVEVAPAPEPPPPSLDRILRLKLPLSIVLAEKELSISEVLTLRPGDVLEFDKRVDDPLSIFVHLKPIGTGVAVKRGEKFGMRIQRVLSPEETIRLLGPSA